jgi:hypothetical protein
MTQEQLAAVFTEWDRRYRANPEEFWSVVRHLTQETADTYGEAASRYFLWLAAEMGYGSTEEG